MLVVILGALWLRPELAVIVGFVAGLLVDLIVAGGVLGLRALAYTVVAYVASRTKHRTDIGPWAVGVWAALLSVLGVVVFLILGSLFGEAAELGENAVRRIIQVPLINGILATLLSGWVGRLIAGRRVAA
jgi:rod shape-determining protein MreD